MSLRLTNTLTRKTETFRPLIPNKVSIYCCGVTVYDLCHLGHARSYISWDVLRRYLMWRGYDVTFVQNFTDIDDKILKKASEENCTIEEVSEKNINAFYLDMDSLGILRADRMPRATKSLNSICTLIKELEASGKAYSVDGDVYFSVLSHSGYGKLSDRKLEDQKTNAKGRLQDNDKTTKRHHFDFALWKAAKSGEPSFESPWGEGRPGWHIECSAMVREELGRTIDIHLGGADLIFPHHENEIAQSEAANGRELAKYWLHNGMVNVEGKKMSKSLGNFTTIRALLDRGVSPMTLRLFVLQAHYRKPLDFTQEALDASSKGWDRLNTALCFGDSYKHLFEGSIPIDKETVELTDEKLNAIENRFISLMNDDLNTSGALAVLFELANPLRAIANKLKREQGITFNEVEKLDLKKRWNLLLILAKVMGLQAEKIENINLDTKNDINLEKIQRAILERSEAKKVRDFAKADLIRNNLKEIGIELVDKPGGKTDWIKI